ncbi:hypothetical protein D3C84_518180 [compost metagenome]
MHQLLHLEALHIGHTQIVEVGVEQLAVRATKHIGRQRLAKRIRLQQHRKASERTLFDGSPREAAKCRPDSRLFIGADGNTLLQQPPFDPLSGPATTALLVDACERLEGNRSIGAQIVILAAQPQHGRAHRAAHVEGEDARSWVPAELQRQRGEQDRLAHARGTDDQRMPHVADMRHQPERRRALGAGHDHRWAVKVVVTLRPGPDR